MRQQHSAVNSRARAEADFRIDSDDPADIVERVKDAWRQIRTPRSRRNDFLYCCGQQDDLTQSAIDQLLAWDWQGD